MKTWSWPIAIALFSASGLVSALLWDGWGDVWAWVALGVPVGVMGWFAWPRMTPRGGVRCAHSTLPETRS